MKKEDVVIIGAGITGLSAGISSGCSVFEAKNVPGGICASYYMQPEGKERLYDPPSDGEAYRFEIGGGHWIWGEEPSILEFLNSLVPMRSYERRSAVYFPEKGQYIPYPIQNHLSFLGLDVAKQAHSEILKNRKQRNNNVRTMAEWLEINFGSTLCDLFFFPFHDLYTAGLYKKIAPKDIYKTPIDLNSVIQSVYNKRTKFAGYNVNFYYPVGGLNRLVRGMANLVDIRLGKKVISIDPLKRVIVLSDGSEKAFRYVISTLPLNRVMQLAELRTDSKEDPYVSTLVVNIGAFRGTKCPDYHWIYIPKTKAGFYRVGFYSNVDSSFLPKVSTTKEERLSIYVEKAYPYGYKSNSVEIKRTCDLIIRELQEWEFIGEIEAIDPTWIDVGYAYSWVGSTWVKESLASLKQCGIYNAGRYARWTNQGIEASIKDGFIAGTALSATFKKYLSAS